jgi:hypothetical protein
MTHGHKTIKSIQGDFIVTRCASRYIYCALVRSRSFSAEALVATSGRLSISRRSCTVCLRNKQAINMSFTPFISTVGWPMQCAHRETDNRSQWWSNRFHLHRILTEIISCRVKSITQGGQTYSISISCRVDSITQSGQHTALVSAIEWTA